MSNTNNINTSNSSDITALGPVRRNMAFLKGIEKENNKENNNKENTNNFNNNLTLKKNVYDENDPLMGLNKAKQYEGQGQTNIIISKEGDNMIKNDDDEHEIIKFEGFIYKITDSNKFKKLWFKIYDKDLFCKFIINNLIRKLLYFL